MKKVLGGFEQLKIIYKNLLKIYKMYKEVKTVAEKFLC